MTSFQSKRSWGTIAPDKRYDIGHVDVRFDVPLGISWELMQVLAQPEIQRAIDQFEKIGKWKFYDNIPIQYKISFIHSRLLDQSDLLLRNPNNIFNLNKSVTQEAGDLLGTDVITMIARVFFIRPYEWVNADEEQEYKEQAVTYENGFVPIEDMPEEFKLAREEAKEEQNDVSDE